MVDGGGGDGGGCSLTLPSVRGKSRLASRVQTVYLISKNLFGGIRERRCAGEGGGLMSENGIKERAHNNLPHIHFPCCVHTCPPRRRGEEGEEDEEEKKKKDDFAFFLLEEEVNAFF